MEANIPSTDEDVQERPGGRLQRRHRDRQEGFEVLGSKPIRRSAVAEAAHRCDQRQDRTQRGGRVGGPCDWCRGHA